MNDLLQSQAAIKSRYHPKAKQPREAGQFVSVPMAAEIEAVAVARKQALTEELIAKGLLPKKAPPGCTMVKAHPRHVPSGEAVPHTAEVLPLFDQRVAA